MLLNGFSNMLLGEGDDPKVSANHLERWNRLIDFSRKKGYAGLPELDHNPTLRKRVFDEFNKENPEYALDMNMVKPIQSEIQEYKRQALENIKAHPESFAGKPEDFMKGISQVDNIFGQLTSNFSFPELFLVNKKNNERKNLGFAPKVALPALSQILNTMK